MLSSYINDNGDNGDKDGHNHPYVRHEEGLIIGCYPSHSQDGIYNKLAEDTYLNGKVELVIALLLNRVKKETGKQR